MDEKMMKDGGAIKRTELQNSGLLLSAPDQRELTPEETEIALNGDYRQGEHLKSAKIQKIIKEEL